MDCIVDGSHGIYVPKYFAEVYGCYLDETDKNILLAGPENEYYWEVWDNILDTFEVELDGIKYSLFQDQDVFLVSKDEDLEVN